VRFAGNWNFKECELKLISFICSTFDMQCGMMLSLSISDGPTTPSLDLQESLEVSAAIRKSRLFPALIENRKQWK
jgi:hypothetical protein